MKCAKILLADGLRKPQPYPGDMAGIFNIRSDAKDWCSSPRRIAQFRFKVHLHKDGIKRMVFQENIEGERVILFNPFYFNTLCVLCDYFFYRTAMSNRRNG